MSSKKITILGSGSAYGCPMCFNDWRLANPDNPRNRRSRASALIELDNCKLIVDCGPDFRNQINDNNVTDLDAVFLSHPHYDHTGGVTELVRCASLLGHPIEIFANPQTMEDLKTTQAHLFKKHSEEDTSALKWQQLDYTQEFEVKGHKFSTFVVPHRQLKTSCLRYQNFAYVPDLHNLPKEAQNHMKGLELLIIECNNGIIPEDNGHSDVHKIMEWVNELKPARTILTHLSARVDYDELSAIMPQGMELAYDGMVIELP